jgi:nitroimidazol reductase NimA-like FMN-containing flavoprotein (pyridoxamine 5'-phosphate oxidase superfamily)
MSSVAFTKVEERFLRGNEIGRLATISSNGAPHVVPVSYLFRDNEFLIAVDYDTRKLRNLKRDRRTALVVDAIRPNRGIMIQGYAKLIEKGAEFRRAYSQFYRAFGWVRADPWKEGEAPFVRIIPATKASWGLG